MTTLKEEIEQEKQEYSKALNPAQNGYRIAVEIIEEKLKYKILEFEKILKNFEISKLNIIGISDNPYCIISYIQEKFKEIFGDFEK